MLPSLGLFKETPCPILSRCQRPYCFFSHTVSQQRKQDQHQQKTVLTGKAKNVATACANRPSKRVSQADRDDSTRATKTLKASSPTISRTRDNTDSSNKAGKCTGPPTIKADISSHTALKIRQTISNKLYEQYSRIYPTSIHPQETAAQHTVQQERQLLDKTSNTAGYKQQAMSLLMQLKKQAPFTESSTKEGEKDGKQADAQLQTGILTTEKGQTYANETAVSIPRYNDDFLRSLILTDDQLEAMQYPLKSLLISTSIQQAPSLTKPTSRQQQQQQQEKVCDRCKKSFIVKAILGSNDIKACSYHFGRLRVSQSFGEKLRTYTCCDDPLGSTGCEKGPHVYKIEQTDELHKVLPFTVTPPSTSSRKEKLLALDCEMGYTTIGMELIRLTVINSKCEKVLDELVLPSHMVIDLNTRYSGIKTLAGVQHNLSSIQKALFDLMDSDTVLLGHGLENDLKALRIIHDKVIDTAALYPHPHGLPYRYGLKVLANKYLSKFIQDSSGGHDSYEDARTCLDLLYRYIGQHYPPTFRLMRDICSNSKCTGNRQYPSVEDFLFRMFAMIVWPVDAWSDFYFIILPYIPSFKDMIGLLNI